MIAPAPAMRRELEGRECYGGLDLAITTDIAAFVKVFPPADDDERWRVLCRFWVPGENMRKRSDRDRVPYSLWAEQGLIEPTEGNIIDYDAIRKRIGEDGERFNIREIAFDRWNATQLTTQLDGDGFTMVPFGQGFQSMAAPTEELRKLLVSRQLAHGGNKVLRWMASNVSVKVDPAGNQKPDKSKSSEKIDGIVALIMGLGRAIVQPSHVSVYESHGIETHWLTDSLDRISEAWRVLFEKRQSPENPTTPLSAPAGWLFDMLGGSPTVSGARINERTALQISAVYACIRVIAESIGSLPLHVYRRLEPRGREKASRTREYALLHNAPNERMTSCIFREVMTAHVLLFGNAYGLIEFDNSGKTRAIWPLMPNLVTPNLRPDRRLEYIVKDAIANIETTYPSDEIIHIPGLSFDGVSGVSPILYHREGIGLAAALETFGAEYFGHGTAPRDSCHIPERCPTRPERDYG